MSSQGQHRTSTANHLRRETRFDTKGYSRRNTSTEIRHTVSYLDRKANLISHTLSQRFKARLKMLVFETCANAIVL